MMGTFLAKRAPLPYAPTSCFWKALSISADAVIFADRSGKVRRWKPKTSAALFRFSAAEALGVVLDLISPEHLRAAHWRGFDDAMASGVQKLQGRPTLTCALHKRGRKLYVEMTFALVVVDGVTWSGRRGSWRYRSRQRPTDCDLTWQRHHRTLRPGRLAVSSEHYDFLMGIDTGTSAQGLGPAARACPPQALNARSFLSIHAAQIMSEVVAQRFVGERMHSLFFPPNSKRFSLRHNHQDLRLGLLLRVFDRFTRRLVFKLRADFSRHPCLIDPNAVMARKIIRRLRMSASSKVFWTRAG